MQRLFIESNKLIKSFTEIRYRQAYKISYLRMLVVCEIQIYLWLAPLGSTETVIGPLLLFNRCQASTLIRYRKSTTSNLLQCELLEQIVW